MLQSEASTLVALLDRQFEALKRGDLAGLEAGAQDLAGALAQIGPATPRTELAVLQGRASRNAACLLAAVQGVRAARRRLEEIAAAGRGLETYDARGRRVGDGPATDRLRQRL